MSLGSIAGSVTPALSVLPVTSRDTGLGDSANYYIASNPTPGTGIITGHPTTLVSTTPALILFNGGLLNVYLLWMRLGITVASTGNVTNTNFSHSIDAGNRNLGNTAGTALTINNTNIMSNSKSSVQATFGAITGATAASSNERIMGNDWFRVALIDIVGDVYEWQYGTPSMVGVGSTPATVCNFIRSAPAIVLQPQSSYVLNVWATTTFTTGITFEVQIGFAEK
jgi:hypothetical protein